MTVRILQVFAAASIFETGCAFMLAVPDYLTFFWVSLAIMVVLVVALLWAESRSKARLMRRAQG